MPPMLAPIPMPVFAPVLREDFCGGDTFEGDVEGVAVEDELGGMLDEEVDLDIYDRPYFGQKFIMPCNYRYCK
jgi:hypothetical protein